ncbi:MAG TPA: hypothetical protein VHE78_02345 [Gemmatimonadaceae bacterium]|nr:hypothetical protein [Gemmatimonadaceae bacterium]
MRTFSTATAAHALGIDRKVLDNLLTREAKALVGAGRRGKERRISFVVLEQIALALLLKRDLGVSLAKGLELATAIAQSPSGEIAVGSLGSLRYEHSGLRSPLEAALADALEEVAPLRRGRPPIGAARHLPVANAERGAP